MFYADAYISYFLTTSKFCACECVCVCVRERERERDWEMGIVKYTIFQSLTFNIIASFESVFCSSFQDKTSFSTAVIMMYATVRWKTDNFHSKLTLEKTLFS